MTDTADTIRHDWALEEVEALLQQPLNDLLLQAQLVHRQHFKPNEVQVSTLLSIKTGTCPEDCKYCPQSGHYNTGLKKEKLIAVQKVLEQAKHAKEAGATRFCMGAAWKNPPEKEMPYIIEMVRGVKALGLETCMTLGMLSAHQANELATAGLDYYNHNLDTSPEFYDNIITTRTYSDRLDTLASVRDSGMKVCSGGILGMGETGRDRAGLLIQLANLPVHPESVPINKLIKIAGTPLEDIEDLDGIEFVKTVAVARIMMPKSYVRLSAGRTDMSDELQALAFMAGANSIFLGDKLLTADNPSENDDRSLLNRLGITIETGSANKEDKKEQPVPSYCPRREKRESEGNTLFYNAMPLPRDNMA
ncbi:biotin synthase BioB [Endozoicomonas sp. Mp262]|uniref:biotin synthase BioB n=1 Tax=Endozoicomonas sp. Mp262 TaxID=2919499 RepID=UPI0021D84BFF